MKSLRSCMVCAALVVPCLAMPNTVAAQGSYTVTKWNIRYWYANGTTGVDEGTYETKAEATAAAERHKAAWNDGSAADITKYKPFPVDETITPPRPSRQQPPLQLPAPARPGGASPPASPAPAPPTAPQLVGKNWVGSETLAGYGRLEFRFLPGNRVQMIDARSNVTGSWRQSGNRVSLMFYDGNCIYTGTVDGNRISGNANAGGNTFTWSVSR